MKSWQIVILGMFAFVAVWSLMNSNPGGAVVTLVVVAALAVLFLKINKRKRQIKKEKNVTSDTTQPMQERAKIAGDVNRDQAAPTQEKKLDVVVPEKYQGAPLVYWYDNVELKNVDFDAVMKAAGDKRWRLDAQADGQSPWLVDDFGVRIGQIASDRMSGMLSDWLERGDPFQAYLQNICPEKRMAHAFLAFYRTVEDRMKGRECTVLKLTKYKTEDAQRNIAYLEENDELEIVEDHDEDWNEFLSVVSGSSSIGRLPKKIAEKYLNEGCAGCFFDRWEFDDKADYVPFVKIYW